MQVKRLAAFFVLIISATIAGTANADQPAIGVVAPLSGPAQRLGQQMLAGAAKAIEHAGARAVTFDDQCNAEGGAIAAEQLIAAEVRIAIGFLCTDAIEAALPLLTGAGIPVITPGVRVDSLTDRRSRTGWLVYRNAPRADAERAAIADILIRRWSDKLFAIVDDGTIYGRELAESFRLASEQAGLKPVFTDTYRPQFDNQIGLAGRLKGAGATHVFAGGNRYDIAILARDADIIGYPLIIAGGEALRAAKDEVDMAPGTLMIGLPEAGDVATSAFLQSFEAEGVAAEGYVLSGYSATEIALQALKLSVDSSNSLTDILSAATFETEAGPLRFNSRGDRTDNPYRLFRYDGDRFVEVR